MGTVIWTSSVTTYLTSRARVVATRSVPTTSCSSLRTMAPSSSAAGAGGRAVAGICTVSAASCVPTAAGCGSVASADVPAP